jgi:hypothetical protein
MGYNWGTGVLIMGYFFGVPYFVSEIEKLVRKIFKAKSRLQKIIL